MMIAAGSICPAGWNISQAELILRSEITVAKIFVYKALHAIDSRIEECHASSGLVNPCHIRSAIKVRPGESMVLMKRNIAPAATGECVQIVLCASCDPCLVSDNAALNERLAGSTQQ
jgi:hypothetical protein